MLTLATSKDRGNREDPQDSAAQIPGRCKKKERFFVSNFSHEGARRKRGKDSKDMAIFVTGCL